MNVVRAQGATINHHHRGSLGGAEANLKKEGLVLAPIFTTKDLLG